MIERPALARAHAAYAAPDDTVILTAPTGDFLLSGSVYGRLIPLLDGTREPDTIAGILSDAIDPAEVYYALRCLEAENCLVEGVAESVDVELVHDADLSILFVDDPLMITNLPQLPWMFVCPAVGGFWIGPRFDGSADAPCWHCLEFRLMGNRPLAAFARAQALKEISPMPLRSAPGVSLLRAVRAHCERDILLEADMSGREIGRHIVTRRLECSRCGDATLYASLPGERITLERAPRSLDAYDFARQHAGLLDPVTGIARGVRKLTVAGTPTVHVYIGGVNRARPGTHIADVSRHLRSYASGKGGSDALARASLTGEIAERHSAVFRGDEPRITGTYGELYERAVHPNAVMLYSERQFSERKQLSTSEDPIPRRLDDDERIEWTPVWSLTENRQKLLPTSLLYFGGWHSSNEPCCFADSNGNAAAVTREAAMLQGTLELIERDAIGLWWFNAARRPAIALEDLDDAWVDAFVAELTAMDREVWVLDVTTDLEVPTYAAVSRRIGDRSEQIVFGFGAHVDARVAAIRALTELGQTLAVMLEIATDENMLTSGLRAWWRSATIESCSFLMATESIALRSSVADARCPATAFDICRTRLENRGLECLVLDQTRADVGVPVVKMLVPGLRHYRRRLAAGRLYSVPVELGWLPKVLPEDRLNDKVLAF